MGFRFCGCCCATCCTGREWCTCGRSTASSGATATWAITRRADSVDPSEAFARETDRARFLPGIPPRGHPHQAVFQVEVSRQMGLHREHVYRGRALPGGPLAASPMAAALVRGHALRLRLSAGAAIRDRGVVEGVRLV